MSFAILAALLWALVSGLSRTLWPRDSATLYALIATGVPITGWLVLSHGPWVGLIALALGAALLRWPLGALFGAQRAGNGKAAPLGADAGLGASE